MKKIIGVAISYFAIIACEPKYEVREKAVQVNGSTVEVKSNTWNDSVNINHGPRQEKMNEVNDQARFIKKAGEQFGN